jgi:hypothetical protein
MQDAGDTSDTSDLTSSEGAASPRGTSGPSAFDADAT